MAMQIVGRERRKLRIRRKISGTAERPRLTVFRRAKHIYAQAIDDADVTLVPDRGPGSAARAAARAPGALLVHGGAVFADPSGAVGRPFGALGR